MSGVGEPTRSQLQRRREELAEQVRELHWDLGGLAYEMAIRDHFRLDVLMRRAAILQERDAELAELERLLQAGRDGVAGACPQCGAPHSRGAQFCWRCGTRLMESAAPASAAAPARPHDPDGGGGGTGVPDRVAHAGETTEPIPVVPAGAAAAPREGSGGDSDEGPRSGSGGAASTLPSPRVSALLVLVFLAFGTILGGAAGSRVSDTLAAAPERLLLPAQSPTAEAPPSSSSSTPQATPESTPAPASSSAAPSARRGAGASGSGPGESTQEESSQQSSEGSPGSSTPAKPAIKHVFAIVLSDEPYAALFGPSAPPYLARTLESKGELLPRYYAVAHQELAGEIALISGQGPTPQTQTDCPTFTDVSPGQLGAEGQARGEGCVYPAAVQTLADQLRAKRLSWRAYIQGLEEAPTNTEACAHPAIGQPDPTAGPEATAPAGSGGAGGPAASIPPGGAAAGASPGGAPPGGPAAGASPGGAAAATSPGYATFRNPFVYFHSLIDTPSCQAQDVGTANLASDLAAPQGAPAFSYIAPDPCDDGSPTPCAPGAPAGPGAAEAFLKTTVAKILASPSYREGGLIVIAADQAPSTGELADSSSCCGQPRLPNLPQSAEEQASPAPPGGGQVGALLLSPLIKGGTVDQEPANTYSLLRLFDELFGLPPLGYAASPRLKAPAASSLFSKGS